jgi:3-oxoacyl-[acyl-carrier protein] reductase
MDLKLTDKTILVTGAARGIGRALAEGFATEGARVIGVDVIEPEKTEAPAGGSIEHQIASVTDQSEMGRIMDDGMSRFGKIDCIVNNAGLATNNLSTRFAAEDIPKTFAVNLEAVFEISREYFRLHKKIGGNVINIASILGIVGAPMASLYGATKGGVIAMSRHFAVEWARYGFRVNAVCPGLVETAMTDRLREAPRTMEANLKEIPMGRFAEPREIADTCIFLASERSSFITGQAIVVDGGYTAH